MTYDKSHVFRSLTGSLHDSARGQAWRSWLFFGDSDCLFCYAQGTRILGLAPEVNKEDFVAILNNQAPGSGERLTARNNTTRTRVVWKVDEVTQTKVPVEEEISNRRVCLDFTFSIPKSLSMYLARTKDAEVEALIHQALRETMDDMESAIQTRVRVDGADQDRSTGNALWACFVHRTTRPVSGKVDPHWHCHALLMNATYDAIEDRWKAAQLGEVISSKGFYQAAFHSRLAEKLMAAGHRLRRTGKDFEVNTLSDNQTASLGNRPTGQLVPSAALEADWGSQLAPGPVERHHPSSIQAGALDRLPGFRDSSSSSRP